MKYQFSMPFGAEVRQGSTEFRLWAPSAQTVELALNGNLLPMRSLEGGWFERQVDVGAGTKYQYRVNGRLDVPDPASRYNPADVHGQSVVVDPNDFEWQQIEWRGRPWTEAIIYELHVGTFSPEGTFAGVEKRLDYLCQLGVTALELMPLADFSGSRNWGYDGVLLFAPDSAYGSPQDLKRLVDAAHGRGMMVFLDVVYNHFGPDGNFLHEYAEPFFNEDVHTPWGAAINFDGPSSDIVCDFYISNALYWLEEYRFDGLRLDAVHAIIDSSSPNFVARLSKAVHCGPGLSREIHLILENDKNESFQLLRGRSGRPVAATAQWADDLHHAFHVLLTDEDEGYYRDYVDNPLEMVGKCLAEGFGYQGQYSAYQEKKRGKDSTMLPADAFVTCLQNHDQIGNRAHGERLSHLSGLEALRAVTSILLLAPQIPMLFMGEEFAASSPFLFFCDFGGKLGEAIRIGRRREFQHFRAFENGGTAEIPDPTAVSTFQRSKLDWQEQMLPKHAEWLAFYKNLLGLRRDFIIPRLPKIRPGGRYEIVGQTVVRVIWHFEDGCGLQLTANLSAAASEAPGFGGVRLYSSHKVASGQPLPAWSVFWTASGAE
jgi:maltooligosyltrehalose trehalohydrolase